MFCRDLTKTYSTVQVISGPLFLPSPQQEGEDGRRYVKYQVKTSMKSEEYIHM